jgi:hypothetical protein
MNKCPTNYKLIFYLLEPNSGWIYEYTSEQRLKNIRKVPLTMAGIVVLVIGATLKDDILILRVSHSYHGYSMYRSSQLDEFHFHIGTFGYRDQNHHH